jgi:hypothetical protein
MIMISFWLPPEQIEPLKEGFCIEVEKLATDQGVWSEITTFFVIGTK